MKFFVPVREAFKLPFWSEEELRQNALIYAQHYGLDIDELMANTGPNLGELDDAMEIANSMKGLSADAWDLFYERWNSMYLIFLNASPLSDDNDQYVDQYFEERASMLSKRPAQ